MYSFVLIQLLLSGALDNTLWRASAPYLDLALVSNSQYGGTVTSSTWTVQKPTT